MSYFGTQLEELLKRRNMKAVELARLSGVGQPMISRYRKGENTWLSMDDLAKLAQAISNDPQEQAELVRAHLLDECKGPGSGLVRITIGDRTALQEATTPYQVKLPADLEQHFATLREWAIKDHSVREVIEGLGTLLSSNPSEQKPVDPAVEARAREAAQREKARVSSGESPGAASSSESHMPESASPAPPTGEPAPRSASRSSRNRKRTSP